MRSGYPRRGQKQVGRASAEQGVDGVGRGGSRDVKTGPLVNPFLSQSPFRMLLAYKVTTYTCPRNLKVFTFDYDGRTCGQRLKSRKVVTDMRPST